MKPKFTWNDGVFIVFSVLFLVLFTFSAGFEASEGKPLESITDVLLGLFFFALFAAVLADKFGKFNHAVDVVRLEEQNKHNAALKEQVAMVESANAMARGVVESYRAREHDERLEQALDIATARICGKRLEVKPADFKKIEAEFYDIVRDHRVKLSMTEAGPTCEFFSVDLEANLESATKKAPAKKTTARKVAAVKVPPVPEKRVTKKKAAK